MKREESYVCRIGLRHGSGPNGGKPLAAKHPSRCAKYRAGFRTLRRRRYQLFNELDRMHVDMSMILLHVEKNRSGIGCASLNISISPSM